VTPETDLNRKEYQLAERQNDLRERRHGKELEELIHSPRLHSKDTYRTSNFLTLLPLVHCWSRIHISQEHSYDEGA